MPGGFLAAMYPANRIFGIAIVFSSILNLIMPLLFGHFSILFPLRVFQGLVEVNFIFKIHVIRIGAKEFMLRVLHIHRVTVSCATGHRHLNDPGYQLWHLLAHMQVLLLVFHYHQYYQKQYIGVHHSFFTDSWASFG